MGAGQCQEALRQQAGPLAGRTVHFLPFQPVATASAVMRQADLAVVSLLPEVFATAVPSKTMMYLQAGCPMLALIEPDCDLARLIKDQQLGVVPAERCATAVAKSILAARAQTLTAEDRERLVCVGEEQFGRQRTLLKWSQLISDLDIAAVASRDPTAAKTGTQIKGRAA
jgi:colanic acid biosynthesis glycosyl transferase WcaI